MIEEDDADYLADVGGVVVAAFPFEAENDDELTVEEGTRLRTLERRDEWWLAEPLEGGKQGIIPVSYVVSEQEYARLVALAEEELNIDVDEVDLGDIPEAATEQLRNSVSEGSNEEKGSFMMNTEGIAPPSVEDAEVELVKKRQQVGAIAVAPDPEKASAVTEPQKAETPDVSYDELAAKFEELQARVASVKLVASEEEMTVEDEPEDSVLKPDETPLSPAVKKPPPSPLQARSSILAQEVAAQQQAKAKESNATPLVPPPPSPKEAAAAFRGEQHNQVPPPPPSPVAAAHVLEAERERKRREEEAERERIASENAASAARAEEMRKHREEEERLQKEAQARDKLTRESIRKMGDRNPSEARGKQFMSQGIEAVKQAVQLDGQKNCVAAYSAYIKACELFAKVLQSGALRQQHQVICERMEGYLSRMSTLEPLICDGIWSDGNVRPGQQGVHRYKDRVKVMLEMTRSGYFKPESNGDECRLKARFAEAQGNLREAFRQYNEGLEFYMTSHKFLKEQGRPEDSVLTQHITMMLDNAETLKRKLSS